MKFIYVKQDYRFSIQTISSNIFFKQIKMKQIYKRKLRCYS